MVAFSKESIASLEGELRKGGFSNLDSPIFDFSDTVISSIYQEVQKTKKPEIISRDSSSWEEIKEGVCEHISKYGDGSLVILCGGEVHIWGAIPYLENHVQARYISATHLKLNTKRIKSSPIDLLGYLLGDTAKYSIKVQIERCIGVVKHLGYNSIEEYLKDRSLVEEAQNLIIGLEETGYHHFYFGSVEKPLYGILQAFVYESKPKSILFIREDIDVNKAKKELAGKRGWLSKLAAKSYLLSGMKLGNYLFEFLKSAMYENIPVEFGAFGHRDHLEKAPFLNH